MERGEKTGREKNNTGRKVGDRERVEERRGERGIKQGERWEIGKGGEEKEREEKDKEKGGRYGERGEDREREEQYREKGGR